jgi:hypothetical protein
LGIENRKPKLFFSLFKIATTTKFFILFYFLRPRLRGQQTVSMRTLGCVRADASCVHGVNADAGGRPDGNFHP